MSKMKRRHSSKADESEHVGREELLQIYHRYRSSAVGIDLLCRQGEIRFFFFKSFGYFVLSKRYWWKIIKLSRTVQSGSETRRSAQNSRNHALISVATESQVFYDTDSFFGTKSWKTVPIKGAQIFRKPRSQLKILGTRRATWNKFHTEGLQILGTTIQNLVASGRPALLHLQSP